MNQTERLVVRRKSTKEIFIYLACLLVLFSQLVSALDLKINWNLSARNFTGQPDVLEMDGFISPGTIVRVPKEFSHKYQGLEGEQLNENALMDWLGKSGKIESYRNSKKEVRREFFFPVEIVKAPSAAKGLQPGTIVHIPIRYLVRKNGVNLVVDEKSPVAKKTFPSKESKAKWVQNPLDSMDRTLQPTLSRVEKQAELAIDTRLGPNRTEHKFEISCPLKFSDFQIELQATANQKRIPNEVLLSIMNMESGGRCFSVRKEYNGSRSIGLFQVNTNSTTISQCSAEQIQILKKTPSLKELKSNELRCLENPIVNLEIAAKILREKYSMVNSRKQPEALAWHEMSPQARDDWRKAVAGYNGGQAYIMQSVDDIRSFNRTHGANLNPEQWENHRKFLFRRIIERDLGSEFFDKKMKFKRRITAIYHNMIYVEAIAGREVTAVFAQDTLVARWLMRLYLTGKPTAQFLRGEGA